MTSTFQESIFKSRVTLLNYLSHMGYNTNPYKDYSYDSVYNMIMNRADSNSLDMYFNEGKKIYCKFHVQKKPIRTQYIEEYIDEIYNIEEKLSENDILIIIGTDNINDTTKNYITSLYIDRKINIIYLSLKELQYNVLEHKLVPKHSILSPEQITTVKTRYNITKNSEFPEISRFDPVAKAIGASPGDIIRIERKSKTAITSDYYRYCVNK
tara:strand:+ start:2441 stop:3073 length:633 start_codon:yes stop_codon:yes gene_type:complete